MQRTLCAALLLALTTVMGLAARSEAQEAPTFWCDPDMERPCFETPPILATFAVGDEQFIAHVVNPEAIGAIWQQYLGGIAVKRIPVATLRRGEGYNSRWSWHTDPLEIQMAQAAIEVCDGLPSHVEDNLEYWLSIGTYCPWSAQVVDVKELPLDADADGDGCADIAELAPDHAAGGQRDAHARWDFFDVTADRTIDLGDTISVLAYFGDDGTSPDGNARDRYLPDPAAPWRPAEADDGVDLEDALVSLGSFGDSCVPALP